MNIHLRIVFRKLLEEINMACNIREYLDSRLHHGRNLSQIQILLDHLSDIRLSHLIKFIEIHGFHVLAVHPAQLHHIENCRGFADMAVVELLNQLVQGKELLVSFRRPS